MKWTRGVYIALLALASLSLSAPATAQTQPRQTDLAFLHTLLTGGSDTPTQVTGQFHIKIIDDTGAAETNGIITIRERGAQSTIHLQKRSLRSHARLVDYEMDGQIDEIQVHIEPVDRGAKVEVPNLKFTIAMNADPEGDHPVSIEIGDVRYDTMGRVKVVFHWDRG